MLISLIVDAYYKQRISPIVLLVIQELDSSSNYPTHNSEKYPTEIRMPFFILQKG